PARLSSDLPEAGSDKGEIGQRIDRLGPEFRPGALAVEVDMGMQLTEHRASPGISGGITVSPQRDFPLSARLPNLKADGTSRARLRYRQSGQVVVNFLRLAAAAYVLVLPYGAIAGEIVKKPRAVVELFTSQGCTSCPKADAMLSEMADDGSVVALAYHV